MRGRKLPKAPDRRHHLIRQVSLVTVRGIKAGRVKEGRVLGALQIMAGRVRVALQIRAARLAERLRYRQQRPRLRLEIKIKSPLVYPRQSKSNLKTLLSVFRSETCSNECLVESLV